MARYTPTKPEAVGMLEGILAQRRREGLTGPHPYNALNVADPVDRRIIGAVYADMAREAMGTVSR